MSDELADFVMSRIAEVEQMARESSGRSLDDTNPSGDHWRWESIETDQQVSLNNTVEFAGQLWARDPDRGEFSLRSVEEYPTGTVGNLPVFVIDSTGDLHPGPARHIAYWDPYRVLAKCRADREIVQAIVPEVDDMDSSLESEFGNGLMNTGTRLLATLASQWDDHPDYQPEWASEVK